MTRSAAIVGPLVLCVACQSAKVAHVAETRPLAPFTAAVVEPFDTSATKWVGDHGAHTPAEVQSALRVEIMQRLAGGGVFVLEERSPAAIVVRGAIDLVDAGSGATRALIGFGAGQSKMTCRVWISEPGAADPSVTLSVEGGSHGRGGLLVAGYITIADAKDAGEQIAAYLLKRHGQ